MEEEVEEVEEVQQGWISPLIHQSNSPSSAFLVTVSLQKDDSEPGSQAEREVAQNEQHHIETCVKTLSVLVCIHFTQLKECSHMHHRPSPHVFRVMGS